MPLTKDFKSTIKARVARDQQFRRAMLVEAMNEFLAGDVEAAKSMLKDYVNATISFSELAHTLHKNDKSIQRMLGATGNPTSKSLSAIIFALQEYEGIKLRISIQERPVGM